LQLQALFQQKNEGARIRAKIKKIENEVPIKSFFVIKTTNATQNTITKLKNDEGMILESTENILQETHQFYNCL